MRARIRVQEAEKAKRELDGLKETTIELPYITADASGAKHLKVKVTRSLFESMVQPLIDRSLEPCRKCIKDAGLTTKDIQVRWLALMRSIMWFIATRL